MDRVLRARHVGLRASADKRPAHQDRLRLSDTAGHILIFLQHHDELIDQVRREDQAIVEDGIVLARGQVVPRLRQNDATHSSVRAAAVLEVVAEREPVRLGEVMRQSHRILRVAVRRQHILPDRAVGTDRIHHSSRILLLVGSRSNEACVSSPADGAAQMSFVDATALRRPHLREIVLCVEDRIASDEVRLAMKARRARLGDDLDAPATWPRELGRVGIVIDAHLLYGRGGDADALHLHAIHNDRRPTRRA